MTAISISICPTSLEFANGDTYDKSALLEAIREFATARYPDATMTCLQIGHRQGDSWATVDGDSGAGDDMMDAFWSARGSDADLFSATPTVSLGDYANARGCVVVFVAGVGCPAGEYFAAGDPSDSVDSLLENLAIQDGTVDSSGDWHWDGSGNPTDYRGNTIYKIHAYIDAKKWASLTEDSAV